MKVSVSQVADCTGEQHYYGIPEVMKLRDKPFDGIKCNLREFIDVSTAFE
jgi:hypothetical protein